jgi:hypothetical protein
MCDSVEALVADAEVLVIGNRSDEAVRAVAAASEAQIVIDLTRGAGGAARAARFGGVRVIEQMRRRVVASCLVGLAATVCLKATFGGAQGLAPAPPELPRVKVDTSFIAPTGQTMAVRAGGDVQRALNAAHPGDVITLEAGATFTGPFTLPAKTGSGWIVVRTSAPDGSLPPPGGRVDPSYARVMSRLVAKSGAVIATAPGAHHYRLIGLEVRPADGVFLHQLVDLGSATTSIDAFPHDLIIDRCYLHGDPKRGLRRAIALNSRSTAVVDSYIADAKEAGADSQAIAGWTGPGPYKIVNNYVEGAGENLIFGGTDPSIRNLVPSDIEVRWNYFTKPLSWRIGDPSYGGTPWTVKNLLELKNVQRVLVEGNTFERNWPQAQNGFAVLFTVRNQDGGAPWSTVEDVTFVNNVVRHVAAGINILGHDDNHSSQQAKRIRIANNLFDDVGGTWSWGRLFQVLAGPADVTIEHNTALQTENIVSAGDDPTVRFAFRDNIAPHNAYGIIGAATGVGKSTLATFFPGATVVRNVITGGIAAQYPADNYFPSSLVDVGFVDRARGNYRLAPSSRYVKAGTDGKAPGVDFDALQAAMGQPGQAPTEGGHGPAVAGRVAQPASADPIRR